MGKWDGYVNRDSVQYRELYGLQHAKTLLRGTLRKRGFCKTWDIFISLGMTDENYTLDCKDKTYNDFLAFYLPDSELSANENQQPTDTDLRSRLMDYLHRKEGSNCIKKLEWLGFFDNKEIPLEKGTPAEILLALLLKKWQLAHDDHDMVILQHEFEYTLAEKNYRHTSTLIVKGENTEDTAMAKHVGLPMAIMVRLLMEGKIALRGVHIPTQKEVYTQILPELERLGVVFKEEIVVC
jgi:saccharopine dehydrogenase (NADP+, L-glutamate forming)